MDLLCIWEAGIWFKEQAAWSAACKLEMQGSLHVTEQGLLSKIELFYFLPNQNHPCFMVFPLLSRMRCPFLTQSWRYETNADVHDLEPLDIYSNTFLVAVMRTVSSD